MYRSEDKLEEKNEEEAKPAEEGAAANEENRDDNERTRGPTWRVQDNIDQNNSLFDRFWAAVKSVTSLVQTAKNDVKSSEPPANSDVDQRLQEYQGDLNSAYRAIRKALGTVPQDIRRNMDRCEMELSQLRTATHDPPSDKSSIASSRLTSSSTTSKKALLAARAAGLQIAIEAKRQESLQRQELRRLEKEETVRRAEETIRRAEQQSEMESRRQHLEDQKIAAELMVTRAELQALEDSESDPNVLTRAFAPVMPDDGERGGPSAMIHDVTRDLNVLAETFTPATAYDKEKAGPSVTMHDPTPIVASDLNTLAEAFADSIRLSRLPVPEPSIFYGDPLSYNEWKITFQTLVENKNTTEGEKIHYLKRYIGGPAREALSGYFLLKSDSAYKQAKALLEKRYGNEFVIAEAFRDKLDTWPKISSRETTGLRKFADFLLQCRVAMADIQSLNILNDNRENRKLLQKLPDWLVRKWGRTVTEYTDRGSYPSFETFVDYVTREANIACNPAMLFKAPRTTDDIANHIKGPGKRQSTANTLNTVTQKKQVDSCLFCKREYHTASECRVFAGKAEKEKREYVKANRLCFGCLERGHTSKDCRKRSTCNTCQGKHPTSLHRNLTSQPKEDFPQYKVNLGRKDISEENPATVHSSTRQESGVLQCSMTVPVYLSSSEDPDAETLVYALLDTQSDTTFISEETAGKLTTSAQPTKLKISTMTSSCVSDCMKLSGLLIRGIDSNIRVPLPTTYTRSCIPMNRRHIPTPDIAEKWSHLQDLAEKIRPLQDYDLGLLIGYNCPQALAPTDVRIGQSGEPFGIETCLGWSIVGLTTSQEENEHVSHRIVTKIIPEELIIDDRYEVAFVYQTKIRETPAVVCPSEIIKVLETDFQDKHKDKTMSQDDIKFLNLMRTNIHQNTDGMYQMPLPFRYGQPELPDNLPIARKRLEHLRKRMRSDPSYAADYQKFMDKMISEGDAELVPMNEMDRSVGHNRWIIPHHGVYHKKKKKLRVVFDCAARYRGTCLNDHLLQGPDLTNTLLGCLLRFRQGPIALAGDIERMFYRFKVDPGDRNYLQFLWWDNDIDLEPKLYRMTAHLFGAASSPGCANFALKKLVSDYEKEFSEDVCRFIRDNFYVDDGLCSCSTVEQATLLIRGARELCQKANIRLHKFVSNSEAVMNDIPESERASTAETHTLEIPTHAVETILGIQWDVQSDRFCFHITLDQKPMTRRGILSTVASVYDPLGCLAPFVLLGKQILQEMCKEKCGWDETLSTDLRPRWERWLTELPKLIQVQLPRCYIPNDFGDILRLELHHFSDASTTGYGQCSYLRICNNQNQVHCCLIIGKSRVVPLKVTTIPRLELTAAVVSVKIAEILREELTYDTTDEYFWTDSKIVLGYIANEERRFHMFVANRIRQIKDSSKEKQWYYIGSKDNPADYASRGLYPEDLINSNWFRGPDFLWKPDWCVDDAKNSYFNPEDPELKRVVVNATFSENNNTQKSVLQRLQRFSSWSRVVTAVAVIQRFLRQKFNPLSCTDRCNAELTILKLLQAEAFTGELKMLEDKSLPKGNRLYKLDPFLDTDGILRVGGRLQRSALSYGVQHPIILPKLGHFVELIIRHCHEKIAHQGRGFTTNELRSRGYWVLGCSKAVSSAVHKCVTCRKLRGRAEGQKMAELPTDRTEPSPPFTYSGVDCFGPFVVKEGRREVKRYGLVVICMASRAVHIETLDDMTTDCFINALRCLIALRGPIKQIRCDQGSNFIGAKRIFEESLDEIKNVQLRQFMANNQCEFLMNSPHASHMGGSWERQIRTIRSVLTAVLEQHNSRLDTSTLRTFLYEAMAIINCRPLTEQNLNDPLGPEPLTPNHLITMKPKLILPPPGEFTKEHLYARHRWRRVQYLSEVFWNRWKKEYLLTLQKRCKWNKTRRDMAVGDLVLLRGEEQYRGDWRLARVVETITDEDGLVRRLKLLVGDRNLSKLGKRTAKPSILERPVHKLILLVEEERPRCGGD